MKHLKSKLMAAIAMLAVAAIMMTSATYAWMTISTNPEISDISANVTANGNFEIALDAGSMSEPLASTTADAGKNETWGNLVDLEGVFQSTSVSGTSSAIQLKPVGINSTAIASSSASALNAFQYPVYGKDGRISKLEDLNRIQAEDGTKDNFKDFGGVWFYTTSSAVKSSGVSDVSSNEVYAVEIDYWLRTNAEGTSKITLASSGISRSEDTTDTYAGETGLGSYISLDTVTILIGDTATGKVFEATYSSAIAGNKTLELKEVEWVAANATYEEKAGGQNYIELTKDTAKLLRMYIFMDGAVLTNADAKLTMTEFTMNVQFTSDQTLTSMDVPMNNYDRASANN